MTDDEFLTPDEMAQIEGLAALIKKRPKEQWEGALVASYDYLDELVNGPDFLAADRMVLVSLLDLVTGVKDSTEIQKGPGVDEIPATDEEAKLLATLVRFLAFDPDRWMLLQVKEGSTKWVVYTSTGAQVFKKKR